MAARSKLALGIMRPFDFSERREVKKTMPADEEKTRIASGAP